LWVRAPPALLVPIRAARAGGIGLPPHFTGEKKVTNVSMNREQKRAAQRAGQVNADGSQATRERRAPSQSLKTERTKPAEFVREVRAELKKVNWPTREEVRRYSIIVAIALVIFTTFVFGLDWVFERAFRFVTQPPLEGALALDTLAPLLTGGF
jgi:preprotein translocase subunit SecE